MTALDQSRPKYVAGLFLAALVVLVSAAERFDLARAEVETYGDEVQAGWLALGWAGVIVAGTFVAFVVGRTMVDMARAPDGTGPPALSWLLFSALAAWVAWQISGVLVVVGWDFPEALRTLLHWAAIVLALAVVGWAGRAVAGDATSAWKRASVVRLQLILLATLVLAVLALPITSDQCLDVLRAWGDGPYTRVAVGIAGGLLLGTVCRASALRLLVPQGTIGDYHVRRRADAVVSVFRRAIRVPLAERRRPLAVLPWAIPLALVAIGVALLGWWPAASALAGVIAMMVVTRWEEPLRPGDADRRSLERLAGTLGVVPMGIVLAGLSSAAVDSLLLPSPLSGTDGALLAYTALAFIAFSFLCGDAQTQRGASMPTPRRRIAIGLMAIAGFAGALAPGSVLDLGDAWDVIAATLLLGVTVVLAARRWLPPGGAPEMWVGIAVVLGATVAVYAEPIVAARTLGAFGLAFIGATGVLLVLHLAGTIGARRAFRTSLAGLPTRAPVVALLGIWVVLAFALAPDTVHNAQTVSTKAEPETLRQAVRTWLDAQAAPQGNPQEGAPYVPMLLIAASGGGSKAAYWTDLVADCLFGSGTPQGVGSAHECAGAPDTSARYERLFLTSSVSGGSVGVRHLVANKRAMTRGEAWVERVASPELLSPVVGWGLFHDLPAFMLGAKLDPQRCSSGRGWACRQHADRTLVQEAAAVGGKNARLEAPRDKGLLGRGGPVTVFNAAEDGAARRVLVARVGLAPHPRRLGCRPPRTGEPINTAVDAHDVLGPGLDVPLSTAAFVSARFPVVAPAARVGQRQPPDTPDCEPRPYLSPVLARDGGYVENSGVLTIAEILPAVNREILAWRSESGHDVDVRPVVVSIDDDPVKRAEEELDEGSPSALGISKTAGPGFLTSSARQAIESCAFPRVSYFRISPPRRVGAKAATGWEVSETTRYEDLEDAIASRPAVDHIRDILAGRATPAGCDWKFPGG